MTKRILLILVILLVIFAIGFLAKKVKVTKEKQSEEIAQISTKKLGQEPKKEETYLENLAKCLKDKGAKFYGASWCGWCKKEKELFGEAAKYLPYIECIDEKTQQLTEECKKVGIEAFPTWVIRGEKNPGFKTPEKLAELSGCKLK